MSFPHGPASMDAASTSGPTIETMRPILRQLSDEAISRAADKVQPNTESPGKVVGSDELWGSDKYTRLIVLEMSLRWSVATGFSVSPEIQLSSNNFQIGSFQAPEPLLLLLADQVVDELAVPGGIDVSSLQDRWNPAIANAMRQAREVATELAGEASPSAEPMVWGDSDASVPDESVPFAEDEVVSI